LKPRGSTFVIVALKLSVLTTVDLDNELSGVPDKIDDEGTDGRLTSKVNAERLHRTQHIPEFPFGVGWPTP